MNERQQITYMQVRLSRMASERWQKPLGCVMGIFSTYQVLEYIRDCFGIFHVQGDETNLDDVESYLKKKGACLS